MLCVRRFFENVSASLYPAGMLCAALLLSACGGGGDSAAPEQKLTPIKLPEARWQVPDLNTHNPAFAGEFHSGAAQCTSCHNHVSMNVAGELLGERRDVSIGSAWETSVMAQATRDPYWHAVVASELDLFPQLEDVINDKCTVCHAPAAHDTATKKGEKMRLFDKLDDQGNVVEPGLYSMNAGDDLFNLAMEGVTCTLCHQMEGTNFGTKESMSGGFEVVGSPTGDPKDRPAYGQYTDPEVGYMVTQSEFKPMHGAHISQSESCATCHNLDVAPVTPDGTPLEGVHFAEQAIFTEWRLSDYAMGGPKEATCQGCHMPVAEEDVYIAQGAENKRPGFAEHTFLGANTVMQDMMMNFSEELGIDPGLDFATSIERNREFLKTAANVSIMPVTAGEPDTLAFDVKIDNLTGHKLPSGYHSRRVFLHVQVIDSNDTLIFESGKMNPDGSLVGVSEDVSPDTWEPHYGIITEPSQVQVYQAVVGNVNGERTHSLLAGTHFLKDNRLLPSGLDKTAVAADTTLNETFGTFGHALTDENFNAGQDVVGYRIARPEGSTVGESYTVVANLRYQPLNYGHLQHLFTQGDRVDQIDMFRTIYNMTTLRDEYIDSDALVIQ